MSSNKEIRYKSRIPLDPELRQEIRRVIGGKIKQAAEVSGIPHGTLKDILRVSESISLEQLRQLGIEPPIQELPPIQKSELELLIEQLEKEPFEREPDGRMPYLRAKPLVDYLKLQKDYLRSKGLNIEGLLGDTQYRFESLRRKTVAGERYDNMKNLVYEQNLEERKRLSEILFTPELKSEIEQSKKENYGFTEVDATAETLGMSKLAFDLLVVENRDFFGFFNSKIFQRLLNKDGNHRQYTPNLLINTLNESPVFNQIKYQYELLARYINAT